MLGSCLCRNYGELRERREKMGEFADRVFEIVSCVPHGKVTTYGQVARMMGRPRSARYVGYALRSNPRPGVDPGSIPCHRVVFKDGSLCKSFAFGGPDVQFKMLREEGVTFSEAPCEDGAQEGVRITVDLGDGKGMRTVRLADIRVRMDLCQWDGHGGPAGEADFPTAPPDFFDWKAEMGE